MRYSIGLVAKMPEDVVQTYWQTLYMHNLLKYRLHELKNPQWKDVVTYYCTPGFLFFAVYDEEKKQMCGECALERFTGLAAVVHYSMHPDYFGKEGLKMAKAALDCLFSAKRENGLPFVSTLIGLTPESNRLAVKHIQRLGFRIECLIPKALYIAHEDKFDNAILSIKEGGV